VTDVALPAVSALLVWWASTGLVLYLDGLPKRTFPWSIALSTWLALCALAGLYVSAKSTTVGAAYFAFGSAIVLWGWHELTFLTGFITGPRKHSSDMPSSRWVHAVQATEALIYHEVAIALTIGVLLVLTGGEPNQFGLWTFVGLWLMRLSSKFNLFLGARNLGEEFLPPHLKYLSGFMRRRPMNALFPFSVAIGTIAVAVAALRALEPSATEHEVAGNVLLATVLALGVLEHVFLMLPISTTGLWRWGLRSRGTDIPSQPRRSSAQRTPVVAQHSEP
jgi:putative photosynthetic complex assembly protein 2